MAMSPYFARVQNSSATSTSVLPSLTKQGNLIAGATARVAVGFLLNPFSVLKARFEVSAGFSMLCGERLNN
jgi:solute carrier family 25 protein 38